MNRRTDLLSLAEGTGNLDYAPAGFFMHFDPIYHKGQAAIDKHIEFFHKTGMDFVKIQYEGGFPKGVHISKPKDWQDVTLVDETFFEAPLEVVKGMVNALGKQALVVVTIYSPFMWATHLDPDRDFVSDLREDPWAGQQCLEITTQNVLRFVRDCKALGVDGFYTSTQGGETFRLGNSELFSKYVKPSDLAVWAEINDMPFNILHVCDYEGGYDDLSAFLDYPGQIVNSSLKLKDQYLNVRAVASMFGRTFMGGLERKGVIAHGDGEDIKREVERVLKIAPERFILAADCTVPSDTPWENLKIAIDAAHSFKRNL